MEFARQRLGFDPDAQQRIVLGGPVRRELLFAAVKSTVTAAKAVKLRNEPNF